MAEYEFTNEDLKFNRQGVLSPQQKAWMEKQVGANNNFSKVTIWIALAFIPIPLCLIGSMLFLNESVRKAMATASPAVGIVVCGAFFFVIAALIFGIHRTRSMNRDFLEARLMVAEGKAKLGTTSNPHWGTGYYILLDDTRIGIYWKDKFLEGERYRVYYCKSRDRYDFLMSFEKLV